MMCTVLFHLQALVDKKQQVVVGILTGITILDKLTTLTDIT